MKKRIRIQLIEQGRQPGDERAIEQVIEETREAVLEVQRELDEPELIALTRVPDQPEVMDSGAEVCEDPELAKKIDDRARPVLEIIAGGKEIVAGAARATQGALDVAEDLNRVFEVKRQQVQSELLTAVERVLSIPKQGCEWMPAKKDWVVLVINQIVSSMFK